MDVHILHEGPLYVLTKINFNISTEKKNKNPHNNIAIIKLSLSIIQSNIHASLYENWPLIIIDLYNILILS